MNAMKFSNEAAILLDINRVISRVALRIDIVGARKFALRRRLAFPLFKLAAWILGCCITIDWDMKLGE